MARLTRLDVPQLPHLVTQCVRPGEHLVRDHEDEAALLQALVDAGQGRSIAIHAYCVLREQIYLLVTPMAAGNLSSFMQAVGRRYVAGYNRRHTRQGGLWVGRYRCTVLDPARYLLDAMMFIELPAWRIARLPGVPEAGSGACSSLGHHMGRRADPLIQDHAAFWALGNTPFEREATWRRLLETGQGEAMRERLHAAVRGGWAVGEEAFLAALAQKGVRRATPKPRGRPRKSALAPALPAAK